MNKKGGTKKKNGGRGRAARDAGSWRGFKRFASRGRARGTRGTGQDMIKDEWIDSVFQVECK